eukprot:CAMPEP_0201893630 /NCGR_PEP_ID=MMETSP0902-20130614/39031_1 /ASSEMBLY_ACC=CAM_ASM_000551 /TAXON_ID=420261 /ORGANISM="Thalassiosira antarctica, Strain CCMP982" /LENGTH=54 /DNA_ID=CAMNT_0048425481 /DNA_START=1992 /DNA_END=2153 /DNA_ORIENTATION=-
METCMQELRKTTLMLKLGNKLILNPEGGHRNEILLLHDDILPPPWEEFTDALKD